MQAPNNFGCCGTEELLFRKGEISVSKSNGIKNIFNYFSMV
jgi:hypothetical protein